jgi:tRNA threonylcarbamoyladenosine biosynthesis protein TsaB
MRILALDTSGLVVSAAVAEDGRLIAETFLHYRKTHSQTLLPLIADMLGRIEMRVSDMDVLALAVGPGSFTGLRIGVCTVKGLAMPGNIPIAPVPTLDALAYTCALFGGLTCPIMDARRDQVYTALYRTGRGCIEEKLMDDAALPVAELCERLAGYGAPVLFCGDGVNVYAERIKAAMGEFAVMAPPAQRLQRGASVAFLGQKMAEEGRLVPHQALAPYYLRQSQAEQRYGKG